MPNPVAGKVLVLGQPRYLDFLIVMTCYPIPHHLQSQDGPNHYWRPESAKYDI